MNTYNKAIFNFNHHGGINICGEGVCVHLHLYINKICYIYQMHTCNMNIYPKKLNAVFAVIASKVYVFQP